MLRNRTDRNENENIILRCKKGFTLIEAVVVLVILAVVAAVAIPTASHYIKLAEFRKNEANAKTAYLAAESVLTWYRASGEWEGFREEIIEKGTLNDTFEPADDSRTGRIYGVTLNGSGASRVSGSGELVKTLIKDSGYDQDFLKGAIAIEVDVETGMVYSAFYATRCEELSYAGDDTNGILDISAREGNRACDNRKGRLLGYYSAEDIANVVDLKPVNLKVTSINLVNSETLSLNWSSNSRHNNEDVNFNVTFYNKESGQKLFSARINKNTLSKSGWSGSGENQVAKLELKDKDGNSLGEWNFPLLYINSGSGQNGRFSLVLDAMMSASLMEGLKAKAGPADNTLYQSSSTSITRLGDKIPDLKKPADIYAVIEAEPYYEGMDGDLREYNKSLPVQSNTENTLFATAKEEGAGGDTTLKAEISRFRHLSNIRYYDPSAKADFVLISRNIDWTAAGAGLYDGAVDGSARRLTWRASLTGEDALDFPSIPLFSGNHALTGKGTGLLPLITPNASLSNLHLGKESVPADSQIDALYHAEAENHYSRYMGLFCEVEGTIEDVNLQDPAAELIGEGEIKKDSPLPEAEGFAHLYGLGLLCGRNQGRLKDVAVRVTDKNAAAMTACLADREEQNGVRDEKPAGIGGLIGVLAAREEDGTLKMLDTSSLISGDGSLIEGLIMEGSIWAELPDPKAAKAAQGQAGSTPEAAAGNYSYGIGGVFGYACIGGNIKLEKCENYADITGNLFTGGVGGRMTGDYENKDNKEDYVHPSGLVDCSNQGLVLCARAAAREEKEAELTGRYFGGILGYGSRAEILSSKSASGRSSGYQYMKDGYSEDEKNSTLLGQYVGGIIGYGNSCRLKGCATERGGYILGSDYVGGIAGGLSDDIRQVITGPNEASVTTNASYVIGNNYVGGIVGKNDGTAETAVHNCVNNGVAAGYGVCIGGIVGYNGEKGSLDNCASYLSDYDHSIYNTIVEKWDITGDCVGGLAGYNNGTIRFDRQNQATSVKSVSSIVTGRNFVGGIIGFNDTKGSLEADYELVGGQIYGTGKGTGGAVGLNASTQLLDQKLTARPSGITGEYCTGGIIGANVVELKRDTTASEFKADNNIGSISGMAFTGGIIGYHRTYNEDQLKDIQALEGEPYPEGSRLFLNLLAETEENFKGDALLPGLDAESLPTTVIKSQNNYTLTITNGSNSKDSLSSANNTVPIRGYTYIGGIAGFCERNSSLVLQNCRNSAEISKISVLEGREGVSLKAFLENEGMQAAADQIEEETRVYMIGGVIGANMENQVIDHCVNTGNMRGFQGLGGIVGFNAGGVFNCALDNNFGNAELDYIGGIAGLNVNTGNADYSYKDINGTGWKYQSGIIGKCTTSSGRGISGRSYVGGIVGFNLFGGTLTENTSSASVTAAGSCAGGIAGGNAGLIQASADDGSTRTVTGTSGSRIGGLVGYNRPTGVISVKETSGTADEVVAVGAGVRVTGQEQAGGIIGLNEGKLRAEPVLGKALYLTARAGEVRALSGAAGGIAGEARGAGGNITRARNRCGQVTADKGTAGGIVAVNGSGMELEGCENLGNVNSDSGHAGGIAAENQGIITDCTVGNAEKKLTVSSNGSDEIGAVCAVNTGTIVIRDNSPVGAKGSVSLTGSAVKAGGVSGVNEGTILGEGTAAISCMPQFSLRGSRLTVGGVAGENRGNGTIRGITVGNPLDSKDVLAFENFSNYQYLGGVAGQNLSTATMGGDGRIADTTAGITDCRFVNGRIQEKSGAAGNCYGGIAGINSGALAGCEVVSLNLVVKGVYTATSTSTAAEKEAMATHVGGVAGKNEENAWIAECLISGSASSPSDFRAGNGMIGGIAGYNKGTISRSGDAGTKTLMAGVNKPNSGKEFNAAAAAMRSNAENEGLRADPQYVSWGNNSELEDYTYNGTKTSVSSNRDLIMIMSTNGNLGGITAYNAPSGELDCCATGNWFLNNKSNAIGVGTGGIIGMNESEKDLPLLLNRAFVGRQLASGAIDRYAGGIIGSQNNTTVSGWKLQGCINYGTVYCRNTHYSGGIIGQWSGTGGTVEKCTNYGNLQTTHRDSRQWNGAAGGIVAQIYHAYENNEYNIISCENYGSIYGKIGEFQYDRNGNITAESRMCANDSAGILGNVTTYRVSDSSKGQGFTIQVLDCVNGSGVKIYSSSMASGIVGFFSCDNSDYDPVLTSTGNITLRIERCRNFAENLEGYNFRGGIFGERYGETGSKNTIIKDCYSVSYGKYADKPVISYENPNNEVNKNGQGPRNSQYINSGEKEACNYYIDNKKVGHISGDIDVVPDIRARANTSRAYIVTAGGNKYLAYLKPGQTNINISRLKIENDKLLNNSGTEVGQLLFKIGTHNHADMGNEIVNQGSDFDDHVRPAYHKLEDSRNLITKEDKEDDPAVWPKMQAPRSASLTITGNRINIKVAPAVGTDPFKYKADVYLRDKILRNVEFYSEDYSFEASAQEAILAGSGELKISVRACSMFDDVEDSDPVDHSGEIVKLLPAPKLKIELVRNGNGLTYRYWLDNIDDYSDFIPEGATGEVPASWKIQINGAKAVEIQPRWNAAGRKWVTSSLFKDSTELSLSDNLQQLLVQAVGTDNAGKVLASEEISVPVYLPPSYTPSMALTNATTVYAEPAAVVSGDNITNLSITVTLTARNPGNVETPPIYRAELIGTWDDGAGSPETDVVIKGADILASANGSVSAVFNSLPEYMSCLNIKREPYVKDLKVRIRYARPGLGNVYTYYSTEGTYQGIYTLKDNAANISILDEENTEITAGTGGTTTVTPAWISMDSPVLDALGTNDKFFEDYCATLPAGGTLFTWLSAPKLAETPELKTDTGPEQNRMQYTFTWEGDSKAGNGYIVSLAGLIKRDDGSVSEVSILTNSEQAGNTLKIDAENWTYESVKLTVTQKGNEGTQIGLAASKIYTVKQRLPRPAQPAVAIPDTNELNYTVEWVPIVPETGCTSYEIYVQPYDTDGNLEEAVLAGTVPVGEKNENGGYSTDLSLESYAGRKILVYLIAQADENDPLYIRSVNGVTYEMDVPGRISDPDITKWDKSWEYEHSNPIETAAFQAEDGTSGGLAVTVDPQAAPPGDSTYLLKAYVFEDESKAQAAIETLKSDKNENLENLDGYLVSYPVQTENIFVPASMEPLNPLKYRHTLRGLSAGHAGKWILFYVRISSGNGQISSGWVANNDIWRLPFVKLKEPGLGSGSRELSIKAMNNSNPDIPVEESWTALYKTAEWSSVELADVYDMAITPKSGTAQPMQEQRFRIMETEAGELQVFVTVNETGTPKWKEVPGEKDDSGRYSFGLGDYYSGSTVGSYTRINGLIIPYEVAAAARLEAVPEKGGGFSYTLILPDADSVVPEEGIVITEEGLRPTASVAVYADVEENDPDDPGQASDGYVRSEGSEINFGN